MIRYFFIMMFFTGLVAEEKTFILVRHAQTDWNTGKRHQGTSDIGLNVVGRMQARLVAQSLAQHFPEISEIYASDRQRALSSAEYLGDILNINVVADSGLKELLCDEGKEGDEHQDITDRMKYPDFFETKGSYNGALRFNEVLQQIAKNSDASTIAIFSHSRAIRNFIALISEGRECVWLPNCGIAIIQYDDENPEQPFSFVSIETYLDDELHKLGYNNESIKSNGELKVASDILSAETSIVLDVGANKGQWAKMSREFAPNAQIFSFEPYYPTYEELIENCKDLDIQCVHLGLGSECAKKTFWVWGKESTQDYSGLNGIHYRPILEDHLGEIPESVEVFIDTLDRFCNVEGISHIDFLKIDTEGNEYNVLLGSHAMLKEQKIRAIQFEYGGAYIDARAKLEDVYRYLTGFGYEIYRILPEGLLPITKWEEELENYIFCNYFALLPTSKEQS